MSTYQRWSKPLSSALWLVVTIAIWIVFAPIQAGGQAAYIVVIGKSMEPNFHLGDLIIVQHESNYKIGDIVAYKNAQLKSNVFHRIIALENNRYAMKGDNNSWVDTYQPSTEEVIGKLWIYLPGAGKVIQRIRTPLNMALIVGVLTGLVLFSSLKEKPKGGKRMNKKTFRERIAGLTDRLKLRSRNPQNEPASTSDLQTGSDQPDVSHLTPSPSKNPLSEFIGSSAEILFFALGLIAFASLILAIISFTRPTTVNQPDDVNFQHIGIFSYSAPAPAGIYDSNTVKKGDPIFPKVTCSTRVDFHYSLFGESLQNVTGTYNVTAQIVESQSGWRTVEAVGWAKVHSDMRFAIRVPACTQKLSQSCATWVQAESACSVIAGPTSVCAASFCRAPEPPQLQSANPITGIRATRAVGQARACVRASIATMIHQAVDGICAVLRKCRRVREDAPAAPNSLLVPTAWFRGQSVTSYHCQADHAQTGTRPRTRSCNARPGERGAAASL